VVKIFFVTPCLCGYFQEILGRTDRLHRLCNFPIEIYTDDRIKEFDEADAKLESLLRKKRKLK
jgi:hypothetical protein